MKESGAGDTARLADNIEAAISPGNYIRTYVLCSY